MQQHNIPALYITKIGQTRFECFDVGYALLGCTRNHIADSPDLGGLLSLHAT